MAESIFDEMKHQIGFDADDAGNLQALGAIIGPHVPAIVHRFYETLHRQPGMAAILQRDDVHVPELRRKLTGWLEALFGGRYDAAYFEQRSHIGRVHVQVRLPLHYTITAMEIIWQDIQGVIQQEGLPDAQAKLRSLHKLLTLELGVMVKTYQESYAARVQAKEHSLLEEKLSRAQRLAEIGQLAASLAHEIKNPLAGISGAIQIIRDGMRPDYKHREIIGEILGQINRLDAVVKDLLIYARPVPPRLALCNLDAIVRRVLTFMREETSAKRACLEFSTSGEKVRIRADETKIEQLILNLVLNAAQASPEGGTIRVSTMTDDDWVRLTVEDSGQGMDETVRKRAFEPFFTTKAKGTGLGLPICKTIVETHGGRISLHGQVGEGTRVLAEFPRAPE